MMKIESNEELLKKNNSSLLKIIQYYSLYSYSIDSLSREFEYGLISSSIDTSILKDFIKVVRNKYINFINKQQTDFIRLVKKEGWYPDGINRSIDFFTKFL